MLRALRKMGLTSDMMYVAGFVSIGLSFTSWMLSKKAEESGIDRADRWGIFIGEWAPTFMALGVGLGLEEERKMAPGTASAAVESAASVDGGPVAAHASPNAPVGRSGSMP